MDKLLIKANRCIVGETYYLTGDWVDYGDMLTVGLASALATASGSKLDEINFKKATCLLNAPVKFKGRVKAIERGWAGCRKGFEFEMRNGEKIYSYADGKFLKQPYTS